MVRPRGLAPTTGDNKRRVWSISGHWITNLSSSSYYTACHLTFPAEDGEITLNARNLVHERQLQPSELTCDECKSSYVARYFREFSKTADE